MNDLLLATTILDDTIRNKKRHPDYKRVTTLAQEYFDIFTGSGIKEYLKRYRKSEDDESFNQMLEIFETTVPSVVHNLDTIFEKPLRSNRIFNDIEHTHNASREEILDRMKNFWQGETESGLDAYLKERWKHLLIYDPNAFIAVEFGPFNPVKEKPQPVAVEYSSTEAIQYEYIKGKLDWLICEKVIMYKARGVVDAAKNILNSEYSWQEGSKFIMYLDNHQIVYTEVDPVSRETDILNPKFVEIRENEKQEKPDRVFVRQVFEPKSEGVPAFRVGYLQDPESEARKLGQPHTCLSMIHYALAFFKKELKSGAELDLTIRAHVFPQKFIYGPKCEGDRANGEICNWGKTANGDSCAVCGGSGMMPVHNTSTDVIVFPIPKKDTDPVVDVTKAAFYLTPPMDLVRFMVEYNDRLTEKAKGAIFSSQAVASSKNTIASSTGKGDANPTTATEQDYSWDNVYDTYRPFTSKYSFAWLFITRLIAIYTDNAQGFTPYHSFPSDYKLKPVSALTAEAKGAKDAGLPQHVLEAIHRDIANQYYADDQDTLTKIDIKNKFHPFSGKSDSEIATIMNSDVILPYYKILFTYFDIIFDSIDEELGDKFYLMAYDKQKTEVETRVKAIQAQVDRQQAKEFKQAQRANALDPFNQN